MSSFFSHTPWAPFIFRLHFRDVSFFRAYTLEGLRAAMPIPSGWVYAQLTFKTNDLGEACFFFLEGLVRQPRCGHLVVSERPTARQHGQLIKSRQKGVDNRSTILRKKPDVSTECRPSLQREIGRRLVDKNLGRPKCWSAKCRPIFSPRIRSTIGRQF